MKAVKISGVGAYLPERVVTNEEISPRLNSSPEWIYSHTGIETRHIVSNGESASSMGVIAARSAMAQANAKPGEIGMIILATTSPDYGSYPSTACLVEHELGCDGAAALDISAACSGFVYALELAKGFLLGHPGKKALVIGSEMLSRETDWSDRGNAMLFGDGAGAAVLEVVDAPETELVSASVLGADGGGARVIYREIGDRTPRCSDAIHDVAVMNPEVPFLRMDGHAVFTFAVRKLDEVIRQLCTQAAVDPATIDCVFAHQANFRILDAVARRMKLPLDKFYLNLKTVGNTSSSSIPLCLERALREGTLKDGMLIVMAGFGAGLTWAGSLMKWPYL